ncbi:MAG TPA: hypothetical protein VF316_25360, partial [Polyangiaceae bacterium]
MSDELLDFVGHFRDDMSSHMSKAEKAAEKLEKELKALEKTGREMSLVESEKKAHAMAAGLQKDAALMAVKTDRMREQLKVLKELSQHEKEHQAHIAEEADKGIMEKLGLAAGLEVVEAGFEVAKEIAEAVMGVGESVVSFVERGVEAATAKKAALGSLSAMMGGDDAGAEEKFKAIENLGTKLGLGVDAQMRQYTMLTGFGYDDRRKSQLMAAGADIGFRRGGTAEGMAKGQEAIMDLVGMAERQKLDRRKMMGLAMAGGLKPEDIYAALGVEKGISSKAAAARASKEGGFTKDEIMDAVLGVIQGGRAHLGDLAKEKAGDSMYAQDNRIHDSIEKMFSDTDTGPMVKLKKRIADMLDTDTPEGSALKKSIEDLEGSFLGFLDMADSNRMRPFLVGVTMTLREMKVVLGDVGDEFGLMDKKSDRSSDHLKEFAIALGIAEGVGMFALRGFIFQWRLYGD